jgi:predicted RNA-binding protein YlxR (DUF448 family)
VPQRRCTGCGRITSKGDLVRLALARKPEQTRASAIVVDEHARIGGRGAYVCAHEAGVPERECLEQALRRGSIVRTLRCGAKIDSSDLLESGSR